MTLRASQLRELDNPKLSVNARAELCCEVAKHFENRGEYDDAQKALSAYWRRVGEHPNVTELEPSTAGEMLLRAGVLTGAIESQNQITNAQEKAKNLISESLTIFESQHYKKKIAEAQAELALCYWRTGEINEARDLLSETLSRLTVDCELKAKAVLRLAIVELEDSLYDRALQLLTDYAPLFQKITNQTLKGSYHVTLGNVLEKLWESETRSEYLSRALVEYAAASFHFEEAEHRCYLANTENNLALLYYTIHRYDDAHEHLDRARRLLASLKDTSGVAQVDETRACVLLKQGRLNEAERFARSAVRVQEMGGRHALLAEALTTHGRALARLRNYGASFYSFRRAIELCEHTGNIKLAANAALATFQELGDRLTVSEGRKIVSGRSLVEEVQAFEHEAIKLALENAKGSITGAARSLGMSHQALSYMLDTRHKDLLNKRTPVRHRPRRK